MPTWAPGSGEVRALWLHLPRTHGARSQETMVSRVRPPRCQPGPLRPTPWERPLDAQAQGSRGSYPSPPIRQGPVLSPHRAAQGPPSCPSTPREPPESSPALPSGRVRDRTWGSRAADREGAGRDRDGQEPEEERAAPRGLGQRPASGPPGASQAYLVLGHGVQTGLVRGQHQIPLDPLVDVHKDGAVLHGAAVGGQVHLRGRQVREGAVPSETALQPRRPPPPLPLPQASP